MTTSPQHRTRALRLLLLGAVAIPLTGCADDPRQVLGATADATTAAAVEPCDDRALDADDRRRRDAYGAALEAFLSANPDPRPELYLTDHPEELEPRTTMTPAAPRFSDALLACAEAGLPGVVPLKVVTGFEDASIPKEGGGPIPVLTEGRLLQVSNVPPTGDRLSVYVSASGGGGFDYRGTQELLQLVDGAWRVTGQAAETTA